MTDFLVIGAGLSGLVAANLLQKKDFKVTVLEKSKGLGGRIATRRSGDSVWDHGAQYINVGAHELGWPYQDWIDSGLLKKLVPADPSDERFICPAGMTSLAKDLAKSLMVKKEWLAQSILEEDERILVKDNLEQTLDSRAVIISAPIPQALNLLKSSVLPEEVMKFNYHKALVLLVSGMGANALDVFVGKEGLRLDISNEIYSVSQSRKKGLTSQCAVTVVFSPSWSNLHFELDDQKILEKQIECIFSNFGISLNEGECQLKKWRYSHPASPILPKNLMKVTNRIYLCGDAFGGGSARGAIRSAFSIAEYFK